MSKKSYTSPVLTIITLSSNDIITASGLVFGGEKGKSNTESFDSLFK